ncbi:hypothetical protein CBR_g12244 [Chara braunii]|uniref:Translocon-associated protein subunit alpha n=1 Tax=Chara braunii TaxID=69332 RepID=A0A388KRI9_CHABU|nr:hypothetical protein CBR_g12244 [Chara braunii]|eukprot:GBG72674.1 hypothetical protein CBR_g12244 [Chara braunii]
MASSRTRMPLAVLLLTTLLLLGAGTLLIAVRGDGAADGDGTASGADTVAVVGSDGGDEPVEDMALGPAPGVDLAVVFPKSKDKLLPAGQPASVLLGINNGAESDVKVTEIRATLNYPYNHSYVFQKFSPQDFEHGDVPLGVQASFAYEFVPSVQLQPREYSLVATVFYEVDGQPHSAVFYNGTIEIVEPSGVFSGETLFLVTLGIAVITLIGMWLHQQFQRFTKNQRSIRPKKIEMGTKTLDETNPWLQGTAVDMKKSKSIAQPRKSETKKKQKSKDKDDDSKKQKPKEKDEDSKK